MCLMSCSIFLRGALLSAFLLTCARGQNYVLTRIVGPFQQRPDAKGQFALNISIRAAIDGDFIVFRDQGPSNTGADNAIWSFNLKTETFTKLADNSIRVPGGIGNFTNVFTDSIR